MTFHIEQGITQSVFQGTSAVMLVDYADYLEDVFDMSVDPPGCWVLGSPFNDFDAVNSGTLYQWHAPQAFDIIT